MEQDWRSESRGLRVLLKKAINSDSMMMMPTAKNTSEVLKRYLMAVTLTVSNTSEVLKQCLGMLLYQIQATGVVTVNNRKSPTRSLTHGSGRGQLEREGSRPTRS